MRPRLDEVPTGLGQTATFELDFQERQRTNLVPKEKLKDVLMSIQAGTVTLVPALTDADPVEVRPEEIHYNAPTLVSRDRFSEASVPYCTTLKIVSLFAYRFLI